MTDNRPVPYTGQMRAPAVQSSSSLAVPTAPTTPLHPPGSLEFGATISTREQIWRRLSQAVRGRVDARIGKLLEWWANETDAGITVTILGSEALVVVEPVMNNSGRSAYRINTIWLDAASFLVTKVRTSSGQRCGPGVITSQAGSPTVDNSLACRLGTDMTGVLGQMPPRAQQLLQEPFVTGGDSLRYDNFYLRHGSESSLGGATLQVWCFLTDLRTITFAAGFGYGFRQSSGPGSWDLTCWRAMVVPKRRHAQ